MTTIANRSIATFKDLRVWQEGVEQDIAPVTERMSRIRGMLVTLGKKLS